MIQKLVSSLLREDRGPDEAHGAVCSHAAQRAQALAHLSQAEVTKRRGALASCKNITMYHNNHTHTTEEVYAHMLTRLKLEGKLYIIFHVIWPKYNSASFIICHNSVM